MLTFVGCFTTGGTTGLGLLLPPRNKINTHACMISHGSMNNTHTYVHTFICICTCVSRVYSYMLIIMCLYVSAACATV